MPKHILLVDDDVLMRRSLGFRLEQAGYRVTSAANAEDALEIARTSQVDLALLDIGLPGMDGLDALHHFRNDLNVPVIFVTARRRELDEALGLEMGADDYISKPFDINVLLAHIKAVLRRVSSSSPAPEPDALTVGDLEMDPLARTASISGKTLDLSRREFDLLYALAVNAGKVLSVDELLSRVWGAEYQGQPQVVYVHIRWLREKIEATPEKPQRLLTVRGVGYKLVA